ncbi:MAG: ketopantoate reductase family protein [Candidatus Hodarchaeota archaeon]
MSFNSIYILGAGSIGSVYGALLSRQNQVTLIGRASHMSAIRDHGLKLVGDRTGSYSPLTSTKITEISPNTLLIVCVKTFDLHESLATISSLIRKDTVILLLQNGLGIEEIAKHATQGKGKVLRGIVGIGAEVQKPGQVQVSWNVTILDNDSISQQVAQIFRTSNLDVLVSEEFQNDLWRKMMINCITNPLSAILRVPTCELISPHLIPLWHAIAEECIQVGAAEGVDLDKGILQLMEQQLPRYKNLTSMLQDIQQGRKTEINSLNGKIMELGEAHDIPTPVNASLTHIVRFMESRRS